MSNIILTKELEIIRKELFLLNKDDILKGLFNPMLKFLINGNYFNNPQSPIYKEWPDIKKIPSKEVLLRIIPILYSDKEIFNGFIDSLAPVEAKLMKKGVWQESINKKELEEIYGCPVLVVKERWSNYLEVDLIPNIKKDWERFITIQKPYGYFNDPKGLLENTDLKLSFPKVLRRLYSFHLPKPKGFEFNPLPAIPQEYEVINWEKDIFQLLPMVLSYILQGKIKFNQKGYVNIPSLRKMVKTLQVKEFPVDFEVIRSLMLVGFMGSKIKIDAINTPVLEYFNKIFSVDQNVINMASFMLPHLKGLNYFNNHQFNVHITPKIIEIFRKLPAKEWISFENLKMYINCRFIDLTPVNSWDFFHKVKAEHKININGTIETIQTPIDVVNLLQYVSTPYLAAHVYFMASWGLMEIAVTPDEVNYNSPFDHLKAFRLTELGAFSLGISSTYTPPENELTTTLSFDEKSLFVRIEGNIALGDTLLEKFANKVSENRYQFCAGKFLKDVTNTKNLIKKIDLFKQTIGQKLPPYWEEYLQQLIQNSKQLNSRSHVVIFTLPPDNRELHRQVAQDELLRKITIKAEKYQLIVDRKDVPAFVQRMKDFGYLIDNYLLL